MHIYIPATKNIKLDNIKDNIKLKQKFHKMVIALPTCFLLNLYCVIKNANLCPTEFISGNFENQ